jgi:hypothetical protein
MLETSKKRPEKQAFLRVGRGLVTAPGHDRGRDGEQLVRQCLRQLQWRDGIEHGELLEDHSDFPPRLFILLATVACQPFDELLAGIGRELVDQHLDAPLIGCSVAGVLTEIEGMETLLDGAALVCLGTRFVQAQVAVANVLDDCRAAAASLCDRFELVGEAINAKRNTFFLAFLPGFTCEDGRRQYRATEIHAALREATKCQMPIVGGVAADNFRRESGWIFANRDVHERSAAVALVESDLRFGIGISHGLTPTGEIIYPRGVSADKQVVSHFAQLHGEQWGELPGQQMLVEHEGRLLLGEVTAEDATERVVMHALPIGDGAVFVSRPVEEGRPLEALQCSCEELHATPGKTIQWTVERSQMDPFHLGLALRFPCAARFEYAGALGIDVSEILSEMRHNYAGVPIVGGLMFGEIGQGPSRRNLCRTWTVSNLLMTDELHPRRVHRRGYEALAKAGEKMNQAATVQDAISVALDAIVAAGFPGGMISLLFHDRESYAIVAQEARGEGWRRIVPLTRRRAGQKDILLVVAAERKPRFVPDARRGEFNHPEAVQHGKVISYYVAPLIAPDDSVIGALQVGLGGHEQPGAP